MSALRIALLAPLYESVPPSHYGGTERVVAWLADELVRRGHDVTLFASGDSHTRARLVPVCPQALWLEKATLRDDAALHLVMAEMARARAGDFDLVHSHIDYLACPVFRDSGVPIVTTLHGRLDIEGLAALHELFQPPVVSISDAQRAPLPGANWIDTVYHGIPLEGWSAGPGDGDYVVFLGRMSPEKRPHAAIEAALAAGVRMVLAAKVVEENRDYFEQRVEPLLSRPGIEFIGEVDDGGKAELLCKARALLVPGLWPEPFGLVMIEAGVCGVPVIARRAGSIPEVIEDGVSGFVCDDDDALVRALGNIEAIDRAACRRRVEERFSVERMVDGYEAIYQRLVDQRVTSVPVPRSGHRAA